MSSGRCAELLLKSEASLRWVKLLHYLHAVQGNGWLAVSSLIRGVSIVGEVSRPCLIPLSKSAYQSTE